MKSDSKSNLLTIRLWREVMERNRYSAWVHLMIAVLAAGVCSRMHLADWKTLTSYGFILMGCVYRIIIYKRLAKIDTLPFSLRLLHKSSLLLIGVGWSLFWLDTHQFYGHFSSHSMFALLVLSAFVSGAVPSNCPRPVGYICLALPMILITATHFLFDGNDEERIFGYCVLLYGAFNIYQLRVAHLYIKQYVEKDLAVTFERDKIQTLFDAVPGFVCIIDENLRYVSMNETAQEFFGLRNYYNQHISIPNPDSEFVRFVTKFMSENRFTAVTEIKYELNPGNSHAILRIQKLKGPADGAMIVAIPIDELVESRERIKDQEAKAFYASKLISLGEMAAGIAHEINNPLAIILGSSDQIARELKNGTPRLDRVGTLTEKIQKTVERIALIIKSLRVLARNGEKDPYLPFKLEDIVEPSLEVSRQRFTEENIELKIDSDLKDIVCVGQEIQLSQVVMNLLSNATDAAIDGPTPRWVRLSVKHSEEFVDVCIQDSGHGIPHEIRKKIMEPFFTTKAINKGTGLGLSISKSIMEQHGGTLTLDENSPHTTFIMRIRKVS